ncbi:MAG: endonuclease domain-containing protein [Chloroflexota bacterium]|nr:endonuclease domain-containing protein [Chloroflexota bacterium]
MNRKTDNSKQTRVKLILCARRMRKEPTRAESLLWNELRKEKLAGFKFRRQHIIQTFIVDFYCPAAKLVIEIDGAIHMTQLEYDQVRETDLRVMGYQILRFTNERVITDLDGVLGEILQALSPRHP